MKTFSLVLVLAAAVAAAPLAGNADKRDPMTVDQGFIDLHGDWMIGEGGSKTHPEKRADESTSVTAGEEFVPALLAERANEATSVTADKEFVPALLAERADEIAGRPRLPK